MTPEEAYEYAKKYGPSDETRGIVCKEPHAQYVFEYAFEVDKCPRDDTRKASYKCLLCLYLYAKNVDKCPRDDTREIACTDPHSAYMYAKDIDKESREDTRKSVCEDPKYAYMYAKDVDKGFHEDTWEATKNTEFEEKYNKFLNQIEKDKII
jgi:hypothetical protein